MAASHQDLVRALSADKGNLSTSLQNLERQGLVTITRTPGGKAEALDLTAEGRDRLARTTGSCD
jgi:DNA-binding MarR family transcriptional regulator